MSADGDTFDIDIYGDEAQDEQTAQTEENGADGNIYGEDGSHDYRDDAGEPHNSTDTDHPAQIRPQTQEPSQGTKRKAPSDESESHQRASGQVDPSATAALKITDLHWWTTEEELRAFCAAAQSELNLTDIAFGEHKINGKSRGEAYLEFSSPAAASAVKIEMEKKDTGSTSNGEAKRLNPFHVYFTVVGNPFKGRDTGAVSKKEYNNAGAGRGGAYNNFNNNNNSRGGFGGRGGGFNRGGGGFNRGGGYMNNNASNNMMNNQQWGMGNGAMGMGFGGNPMMAIGGYGNMGRGGMGGMMGRGGFGGMGNMGGGMMGMGGRGGGGMMMGGGRGGWGGGGMMGGGMQPGYGGGNFGGGMGAQQGSQGQAQNQANKRMKAE